MRPKPLIATFTVITRSSMLSAVAASLSSAHAGLSTACRLAAVRRDAIARRRWTRHSTSAVDRIDAAIARIEAQIAARADAADALARRHAALKARMAEAVSALDDVIARESAG